MRKRKSGKEGEGLAEEGKESDRGQVEEEKSDRWVGKGKRKDRGKSECCKHGMYGENDQTIE